MSNASNWRDVKTEARAIDPEWDRPERVARRGRMREQMLASVRGAQLAEIRKQLDMTQTQLAEAAGVSQARISQIENGEITSLETLRALRRRAGRALGHRRQDRQHPPQPRLSLARLGTYAANAVHGHRRLGGPRLPAARTGADVDDPRPDCDAAQRRGHAVDVDSMIDMRFTLSGAHCGALRNWDHMFAIRLRICNPQTIATLS
jgi:transcriptional regulator with XRE-family HTH domain